MFIDYEKLPRRDVLCIDVKSFFASVEAIRRGIDPLEAYIIVVSKFDSKGAVVLAASPKIKKEYGIKTGSRKFEIPTDDKILLVEPSMKLYIDYNRQVMNIFRRYVAEEDLFIYSIDEAFLDVSSTRNLFGDVYEISNKIIKDVENETGLVVNIGIGDNPLLAKLALDNEAKHAESKIAYWSYEDIPNTLWKIPKLTDMWGINKGFERRLNNIGINSVYELAHYNREVLEKKIGVMGTQLFFHAWGVDYSRLSERVTPKAKSFSRGQMLNMDYTKAEDIMIIMYELIEDVSARLRKHDVETNHINLGIRFSNLNENKGFNVSRKLSYYTSANNELKKEFKLLFEKNWDKSPVRQVVVACGNIAKTKDQNEQLNFFKKENTKSKQIDKTMDEIRDKYGKTAIFHGYNLLKASTFKERSKFVGGHVGQTNVEGEEDEKNEAD